MRFVILIGLLWQLMSVNHLHAQETLPPLNDSQAPQNYAEMWSGFDPRAEPLETEILHEWEEDEAVLRVVRFRIGVFKGETARLAAVYGFPKGGSNLPGLLQIHGGGQFADYKACLLNAKRGYATLSIAWAGRISAPEYNVNSDIVKLFWDHKTDDPRYKVTTDWGALDGYHAPSRNPGNIFPSAKTGSWTLDAIESPRNSGWFLCAVAARRALTFLERQPEVDPTRLGVYGHSMGGKLTVMTAPDPRVKAAAPSCGGISDRDNRSPLFRTTLGDDVSLREISVPIIFLSPANDFHGRIRDLPSAVQEIQSEEWRVTCAPHHNHQDTPPYEVATLLWFDQHLKNCFTFPQTPTSALNLVTTDGVPEFSVQVDSSMPVLSVDAFYTQHGKPVGEPSEHINTQHRYWHHAGMKNSKGRWTAKLPLSNTDKPLWVYANVRYELDQSVTGAGYYYRAYTAKTFNISSVIEIVEPEQLVNSSVKVTMKPSHLIESFAGDWEKAWFTYRPNEWARSTHKLYHKNYRPPSQNANLSIEVMAAEENELVILLDDYAAVVPLSSGNNWGTVHFSLDDFKNHAGDSLPDWNHVKRLKLSPSERLQPERGSNEKSRVIGKNWNGPDPQFRNLRWEITQDESR